MLTDIFASRYLDRPIWSEYTEIERRLLNQSFGVVKDALPYRFSDGKDNSANVSAWQSIHDRLARELGVHELSPRFYSYTQPNGWPVSGTFPWDHMCDQFVNAKFAGTVTPDRFVKERLSFVELALRFRGEQIAKENALLPTKLAEASSPPLPGGRLRVPGDRRDSLKAWNRQTNEAFGANVAELNERFRQSKAPLTYHNGFIQVSLDDQIEERIARPFWELVSGPLWTNVDIDMKEALDRRDSNDKDPALFAAKALESAIKIVSDRKGWTRGTEKGAAQYVDNLISKANGGLLATWEGEMLKDYFRRVRNSLGHGPGSEPMPVLTLEQTDWAIETAMSWVRTLVRRVQ